MNAAAAKAMAMERFLAHAKPGAWEAVTTFVGLQTEGSLSRTSDG